MAQKKSENELIELNIEIKKYLKMSDKTLTQLAELISNKYQTKETQANLSKKINTGSLNYIEAKRVADVLGYKIEWIKK